MRLPALAAALALVALVSGCVPQSPAPVPAPAEPSYTPLFATDEEALAAAEEAYREYQAMSDLILAEGGSNPDRIDGVVFPELAAIEKQGFKAFRDQGFHAVGNSEFSNLILQRHDDLGVIVYLCSDISHVNVLDANGQSVTQSDRHTRSTFEVEFRPNQLRELIVFSRNPWPGSGVC